MGKKGSRNKGGGGTKSGSITLREESVGKKKQTHVNAKSMLKLEHIKNLAIWASGESSIASSLGAFFGQRLAASAESLGVAPDNSLFTCQRCESILHAGYNCTVRIEKNKRKRRNRCKKPGIPPKNYVVYDCHFCSHRNLKRGTPNGYMKQLYPTETKTSRVSRTKSTTQNSSEQLDMLVTGIDKSRVLDPTESAIRKSEQLDTFVASFNDEERVESATGMSQLFNTSVASIDKERAEPPESATQKSEQIGISVAGIEKDNSTDVMVSFEKVSDDPMASPATPLSTATVTSLLDSKRRKRNRAGAKKKVESQDVSSITDVEKTISASSKRKRKSWTSLKEIAESESSKSKKISNLSIPFIL